MKLIKALPVTTLVVIALGSWLSPVSAATSLAPSPSFGRMQRLYHSASTNWSGYAVANSLTAPIAGTATDVSGSWTVPTLTCTSDGYAAVWVGLDGYNSSSVEQLGIESECHSGKASYYAWTEMYPRPMRQITTPVHPGDKITAEVRATGNTYRLSLTNVTTKRSYSTSQVQRGLAKSSAEWVVEAPSNYLGQTLPLANFGNASFTGASATIAGHTGSISAFANDPLTMVNSIGAPIAVPTALSPDGSAFSVAYQ